MGGVDRREQLVRAAFRCLAEDGFEGLRMRTVAAAVGVNIATVHYHFATKEDLVRGVVDHAQSRFDTTMPDGGTAAERLRAHLRSLHRLLASDPDLRQVLAEIGLRAHRDPTIAAIVRKADERWYALLTALLRAGVEEGGHARDLDVAATATLLMTVLKGECLPASPVGGGAGGSGDDPLGVAFEQFLGWISTVPPATGG